MQSDCLLMSLTNLPGFLQMSPVARATRVSSSPAALTAVRMSRPASALDRHLAEHSARFKMTGGLPLPPVAFEPSMAASRSHNYVCSAWPTAKQCDGGPKCPQLSLDSHDCRDTCRGQVKHGEISARASSMVKGDVILKL